MAIDTPTNWGGVIPCEPSGGQFVSIVNYCVSGSNYGGASQIVLLSLGVDGAFREAIFVCSRRRSSPCLRKRASRLQSVSNSCASSAQIQDAGARRRLACRTRNFSKT